MIGGCKCSGVVVEENMGVIVLCKGEWFYGFDY